MVVVVVVHNSFWMKEKLHETDNNKNNMNILYKEQKMMRHFVTLK
jgi:hypothetical protein